MARSRAAQNFEPLYQRERATIKLLIVAPVNKPFINFLYKTFHKVK